LVIGVRLMEMRQIKAFLAIAETGTFTAGAEKVHLTQAAISMQIRQLETEIGVPVFIRAPRRVMLTEAGEMLLGHVRRILREHDSALAEIAEVAGAERGRLRIGSASANISAEPLPKILRELRETHPGAELTVVSGRSAELVQQILAGDLDLAFVSLPVEAHGVQTETLIEDDLVAIASPKHSLADHRVVSAYMLAGESLILGERGGNTRRLIDQFFAAAGLNPSVTMELSRPSAIKRMVEEGMGVGSRRRPAGLLLDRRRTDQLGPWYREIERRLRISHYSDVLTPVQGAFLERRGSDWPGESGDTECFRSYIVSS
jgi:DNA-binding transcriptional LysR family regulator